MSSTKLPPHDEMAEKAVLGGILIDTAAIADVAEILQPKHFYFESHRLIYYAILALFEKNQPIDVVTVSTQMKSDGNLQGIGGTDYIAGLIAVSYTHLDVYKRQVWRPRTAT